MKKSIHIFKVFSLLFVAVLLLGCLTSTPDSNVSNATVSNKQIPVQETSVVSEEKEVVKTADSKPSVEKVNESISQAIADGTYTDSLKYNYHSESETVSVKLTVKN